MDDGHGVGCTRPVAAIVVILVAWIGGWAFMLGGGMAGGTPGSLVAGAGLAVAVGGTLAGLGAALQARYWVFRLAAAALLLAAGLLFASAWSVWYYGPSFLQLLGMALLMVLLALATLRWGRR
jgi:hypothetical protein